MSSSTRSSGTSLGKRAIALLVLLVAAWILFQIIKGFVIGVFFTGVVILGVVAVFWAWRTIRSD